MIGMYALYGDALYNINDQQLNPNGISIARSNHVEQIFDAASKLARVDVTLANSTGFGRPLTNGEYYASAVEKIKNEKLTEVERLASVYRVFLGFTLMDANNVVADEGFMVKDVKPALKYVPLHLNDTNEFLSAFSLEFNTRFSRHYRVPVPAGISATKTPAYRLYITSVSVYQLKATATVLQPSDKSTIVPITPYPSGMETNAYGSSTDKGFRNWNNLVNRARSMMLEQTNSPELDGRMAYTMDPNFINESACIFNTATDNLKFEAVNIGFGPRCVEVNLSIALDGLFIVDSAEDIDQYLKANEESDTVDPSVPGADDGTDEPVVNPDNPDGKDPNTIPNPENPNTGSDEEGGTTEETPSDTPSGDGDAGKGDVTDPSGEEAQDPAPGTPSEGTGGDSEAVDPKPDETTGSEDQKTDPKNPEQTETV